MGSEIEVELPENGESVLLADGNFLTIRPAHVTTRELAANLTRIYFKLEGLVSAQKAEEAGARVGLGVFGLRSRSGSRGRKLPL